MCVRVCVGDEKKKKAASDTPVVRIPTWPVSFTNVHDVVLILILVLVLVTE